MQLYDVILIQVYLELNNTNDKGENRGGGIAVCYLLKTENRSSIYNHRPFEGRLLCIYKIK